MATNGEYQYGLEVTARNMKLEELIKEVDRRDKNGLYNDPFVTELIKRLIKQEQI